jgi:hypothetical protein
MSRHKKAMPARAMHAALTRAMQGLPPVVTDVLLDATPTYLSQRAIEAIATGDAGLAAILLTLSIARSATNDQTVRSEGDARNKDSERYN